MVAPFLEIPSLVATLGDQTPFPGNEIIVVKTRMVDDSLHWSREPNSERVSADDPRLLMQFVELAGAPKVAIAEYAERFGPLWLCAKHGQPVMHQLDRRRPCLPKFWGKGRQLEYAEPLRRWRYYSRQARAILNLSIALSNGEEGDQADWQSILGGQPLVLDAPPPLENRMACLSYAVNRWLSCATVSPFLCVMNGRVRMTFVSEAALFGVRSDLLEKVRHPQSAALAVTQQAIVGASGADSLFAAIAVQLAFTACQGAGLARCSACGTLYSPTRAPAVGRLHFCPDCGRKASRRLAKRRSRQKAKAGGAEPA
jgi:hypothetical protein